MGRAEERYIDGSYLLANPDWHAREGAWKAEQCARLLGHLHASPASICDVGCGVGAALAALGRFFPDAHLTGVDISPMALKLAKRAHPSIRFDTAVTDHYELLLVLDVLEHVEDCFGFVRGLRPHGDLMLFHIPLELSWFSLARGVPMAHRRALGHIHYFSKDTALALVHDTGYDIVRWVFTPAGVDFAPRLPLTTLRRIAFRCAPDTAVLILGGYGLLVAAKPAGTWPRFAE